LLSSSILASGYGFKGLQDDNRAKADEIESLRSAKEKRLGETAGLIAKIEKLSKENLS
jgi:hypothetical protein